ncbi:glycosyltransferase involved in cell wall biosynthesis [Allofrancisella inopinata]|uniref:Glycosyltransferase family 1 protein n=1 Tax=Allofrancisella inopinata TaxID=1085647 RepID=A0AAE6YJ76_9GAMM|nr:glycosyltransferase [Allofrancisella inopinata]QIV95704.1 glycosyltransferase family 1 protein [Allofrancisella inopinata]TDT72162.1 glycosyltransferase involved in cell wall biosynthesis [Allofrancisella inopinata]
MNIVINNPAAKSGGALTILKSYLEQALQDKENNYYFFVSLSSLFQYESSNVKIFNIGKQSRLKRILWDSYIFRKELKRKNIKPDTIISLQNTPLNVSGNIEQIVYFHQALSISDKKWNIFRKDERIFWFYRNIYPFFIKRGLSNVDKVIVQAEWVKKAFSKEFEYSLESIEVVKPKLKSIDISKVRTLNKSKFRIFYPAFPLKYKNHHLVIKWLSRIDKDFECIFTFSKNDNSYLYDLIVMNKLESKIRLVGKLNYDEVLEYYNSSNLVLFPSEIETIGMPLIEAVEFINLKIIVSDQEYSREALGDYHQVKFININNHEEVIEAINQEISNTK